MTITAIPITELAAALELGPREFVSLVGGGGKTTALFALGDQLEPTAILTTTTKMGRDRTGRHEPLLDPSDGEVVDAIAAERTILVWRGVDGHRALGFPPATCDRWFDLADHVVVEADGSRRRPFKAPIDHEPVVPSRTTVLVAGVGAAAFGGVIADVCHRPERVAAIAGCRTTDLLTPPRLAAVLSSDRGSRKDCPAAARFVVLLNRVTDADGPFVAEVAERLGPAIPVVAVAPFAAEDAPDRG